MKLDVWQKSLELHQRIWQIIGNSRVDFKFRSQILDAAQSVSSNIAEGYSRRSINEYIQHLYIALGSLSETLTRTLGLRTTNQISDDQFCQVDTLHFEVENKLIRLVESLERKKKEGSWIDRIGEEGAPYDADYATHGGE